MTKISPEFKLPPCRDDGHFNEEHPILGLPQEYVKFLTAVSSLKFQLEVRQSKAARKDVYATGFVHGFEAALALVRNTGANVEITTTAVDEWGTKFLKS